MPSTSHLDAGGDERNDGMHVLRDAWCRVQRDRGPDRLDVPLGDTMAPEKVSRDVGAVHLEALMRARMRGGKAHVVEHGAGVKEFGVEAEAAALAGERTPVIDAARMTEQQRRLGILDQFGHFTCQFAVRNDKTRYGVGRPIACG
jgi:hypothetical protein